MPTDSWLSAFRALSIADVTVANHRLGLTSIADKQCATDPMPARLLKENVDFLAAFITVLFNNPSGLAFSRKPSSRHTTHRV